MDAVFDEGFTSPLSLPDLPFQGAVRLRDVRNPIINGDIIPEVTGSPSGVEEQFPEIGLPLPTIEKLNYLENTFLPDRGAINQEKDDEIIKAFFASLPKNTGENNSHTEFLHAVHDLIFPERERIVYRT